MSESHHENEPKQLTRHPIIALILDNPISALNTAAILIGGGIVYASNEARMVSMEKQITRVEEGYKQSDVDVRNQLIEARTRIELAEGRNSGKIEAIGAQVTAASVKLSAIEASLQFLVSAQRRKPE